MAIQLDLFASSQFAPTPADFLHCLAVQLPDCCQCGSRDAVIGEGKGPHRASLFCSHCDRHRGWMANETHDFVTELVEKFGKPTTPIPIPRRKQESNSELNNETTPIRSKNCVS